jgi:20S proteasome alpha/beta subunit
MCCDLQFTVGGMIKTKGKTKIFRVSPHPMHYPEEEFIIGFCGNAAEVIDVADFYYQPENYKTPPKTKNLSGIVLTKSGKIFQFDNYGVWLSVNEQFAAAGSGAMIALGALHVGAFPKEAVLAACKVDPYSGMGTKLLSFN